MLPCFGLGFGAAGQELLRADRAPFAVAGLVLGAAWQLLYRRDLVDRLIVPTVVMCVVVGLRLVSGEELLVDDEAVSPESVLLYVGGVLAGLILAEAYLRRRDRRAEVEELSLPAAPGPSRGSAPR
jgi:ABC-type nitrate/sulfonate/bicarbonate transport system permease component